MKIDPGDLRRSFDRFLATPSGKAWLENVGFPGWELLIGSAIQFVAGWLQLFTIIWLPRGVRWIISGITFRPYRQSLRKRTEAHLQELQIIPACAVISGPTGRALVLGSLMPIESTELIALSFLFSNFYSDGSDNERDTEIVKMLKDDVFQEYRRRRVPEPYNKGRELFLFDTDLEFEDCRNELGGKPVMSVFTALAVQPGETGFHLQVPWKSVEDVLDRPDRKATPVATSRTRPAVEEESTLNDTDDDVELLDEESLAAKAESQFGRRQSRPETNSFSEHLKQLGTVNPQPLFETTQADPPLKIHVVIDEDGDQYLVTEGMSLRPMTVPPGGEEYQYAELSILLRDNWPLDAESLKQSQYRWPMTWLRKVASYPHQNQTWLGGPYAIIANGEPPAPLGPNTELTCLLVIANPRAFGRWTREDGKTVVFYDVWPLYTEERNYEKQHGIAALMGKFEAYGIAPWLNPNRVNTALLTDEELAEIDASRDRHDAEPESDTYAIAAESLEVWDDDQDVTPVNSVREAEHGNSHASLRRSRSGRSKRDTGLTLRRSVHESNDSHLWLKEFLGQAGNLLGVTALGTLLAALFPPLVAWIWLAFVLGAVTLLGAAWFLSFRHAQRHDKLAVVLFLLPWHFIKYGIRHLPDTRSSVTALGLFLVWVSSPSLFVVPFWMFNNWLPWNNPVANRAKAIPKAPEWVPPPPAIPEGKPANADALPVGIWRGRRGGQTTTTIRWSDGTVTSTERPALSMSNPTADDLRRRSETLRQMRDQKDNIGAVIIAEVKGSEMEFIYGGKDGIYSLDSSLDAAAVHAGIVKVDQTAKVQITILDRRADFPMIERNGIISFSKGVIPWESYKIEPAP